MKEDHGIIFVQIVTSNYFTDSTLGAGRASITKCPFGIGELERV